MCSALGIRRSDCRLDKERCRRTRLVSREDVGDIAETTQDAYDFDPILHRTIEDDVIPDGEAPK